jgi:hypothetical protein
MACNEYKYYPFIKPVLHAAGWKESFRDGKAEIKGEST